MINLGKNFWRTLGLACVLMAPSLVHADGLSLNVNVGADDEAHFHFSGGKRNIHPMIWKAAKQLQNAKHTLWAAANDFGGHKLAAIQEINRALDQLQMAVAVARH